MMSCIHKKQRFILNSIESFAFHSVDLLQLLMKFQDKSAKKKGSYIRVITAEIRAVWSKGALLPGFQNGSSQVGPKMFNPSIL